MSGTAQILADNVTLTGSYVASTNVANIQGNSHHTLYVVYSPDTNSTNAFQLQIDISPDGGTTWHQWGGFTNSTGTLTKEAYTINEASAGTTDQILMPYVFEASGTDLRVRALETNTPEAFRNIAIEDPSNTTNPKSNFNYQIMCGGFGGDFNWRFCERLKVITIFF